MYCANAPHDHAIFLWVFGVGGRADSGVRIGRATDVTGRRRAVCFGDKRQNLRRSLLDVNETISSGLLLVQ